MLIAAATGVRHVGAAVRFRTHHPAPGSVDDGPDVGQKRRLTRPSAPARLAMMPRLVLAGRTRPRIFGLLAHSPGSLGVTHYGSRHDPDGYRQRGESPRRDHSRTKTGI